MAANPKSTSKEVEEYLSRLPEDQRAALEKLRQTIWTTSPDAVEVISYQVPTFKYRDRMLVSYAAFKEHCSFFPGAEAIETYKNDLKSFTTSKGTVRFTPDRPLSAALIKKLVKTRRQAVDKQLAKNANKGKAKKAAG